MTERSVRGITVPNDSAGIAHGALPVEGAHGRPCAPECTDAELADEPGPAPRAPSKPGAGRQRTQEIGLGLARRIAGLLELVIVEGGDLLHVHSVGGEPTWDVDVAQPLHVGEHLVAAGAGGRTGGGEGVAEERDSGLA